MRYVSDGAEIKIGDRVLVEGNVRGLVVCDFDNKLCLNGHENWLGGEELVGGGTLVSGIMVETEEPGMVHYASDDEDLFKDSEA